MQKILKNLKKLISLDNPFRLFYHYTRAIIANVYYKFPSKDMHIIWITWTNWKTTTTNIIAKWLRASWKKVFMFSTINIILWDKEYENKVKMTSPDVFELQKWLSLAKAEWCEIAIIETASHWIKMHRIWGLEYDTLVLTNITQDHLDLHRTMKDYVDTKLSIFKKLITYKRKGTIKKTAIINIDSEYSELFLNETYDSMYTYWVKPSAMLKANNKKYGMEYNSFTINITWKQTEIITKLRWEFNVYNLLAAIWVFMSMWIKPEQIQEAIKNIDWIPWRMEEVKHNWNYKIFIDYAHTPDALENILDTLEEIVNKSRIITVFWATWDRDTTKRPIMWEIVSRLSDVVILTEDDNYTENIEKIIKDVLPWIERKEWENFWIITDRRDAIRTALVMAEENDIVLITWKWDEHVIVRNNWPEEWHDKTVVLDILKEIDDNRIM